MNLTKPHIVSLYKALIASNSRNMTSKTTDNNVLPDPPFEYWIGKRVTGKSIILNILQHAFALQISTDECIENTLLDTIIAPTTGKSDETLEHDFPELE